MSKIPVRRLLTAIVELYRAEAALGGPASTLLSTVLQAIAATPYPRSVMQQEGAGTHTTLPVRSALAQLESGGPLDAVLNRLRDAEPHLDWLQDAGVAGDASAGADFADKYGTLEIVGRDCIFRSPSTSVGFLLLDAGVEMPAHQLVAEQLYHVVGGAAEWRTGDRPWRTVMPGVAVQVPPTMSLAVRTNAQPMLALYCRRSEQDRASSRSSRTPRKTRAKA